MIIVCIINGIGSSCPCICNHLIGKTGSIIYDPVSFIMSQILYPCFLTQYAVSEANILGETCPKIIQKIINFIRIDNSAPVIPEERSILSLNIIGDLLNKILDYLFAVIVSVVRHFDLLPFS